MSLVLGDNFDYKASKPLDGRLKYDTLANMKAVADATMYDGCLAYCVATDKTYQWKSTNTVDTDTGKWREFSSGGGGATYTAGNGINISQQNVISLDTPQSGDMSQIVNPLPTPVSGTQTVYKTATLTIGDTTVTFSDLPTTGDYIIDFFTDTGINYTAIEMNTGSITLTFKAQETAVTVYCGITGGIRYATNS